VNYVLSRTGHGCARGKASGAARARIGFVVGMAPAAEGPAALRRAVFLDVSSSILRGRGVERRSGRGFFRGCRA
jgi:hypothetical protein